MADNGGVNAIPLGTCLFCEVKALVPYNSDTVKNYEVGCKGSAGRWLRYSAAVYREDWNNIQIPGFSQANWPVVINGKAAKSQGVELEVDAPFGSGWSATIGYGFTDAKIVNNFVVLDPIPNSTNIYTVVAGNTGDRLPYVPRQTATAELGYTRAVGAGIDLDVHANAAYHTDITTQLNPTVLVYRDLGGFTTINGSVGLGFGKGWHSRLFVTNLTNTLGVTSSGPLLRLYDDPRYRVESPTRPRTVGIGVDYKFE
jgi:iron complex outermembrane receptor protein